MLFDTTDFDISFFEIPGSDFNKEKRIDRFYSVEEGFLRGNMFKDEYEPYHHDTYYKLEPKSKQEAMLYSLMAYSFAINDFNLYLDLHPEDKEVFELFQKYVKEKNKIEEEYTTKYGPITVTQINNDTFSWIDNPWPWDGGSYV